jgi:S1-C subfamily serine protease
LTASEPEANEGAADRLLATTATVRFTVHGAVPQADEVVVASGALLGKGRLVTFGGDREPLAARFRVTLPTGDQAEAKLRVWDHYSGLLLLKIDAAELPGLEIARDLPKIGATVLTAAAAGIERPAVSAGILGGADRTLPVVDLPPLLQCDLRTTETSSGAAVVDRDAHLIGIVAANTAPSERPGWTYAVPMSHVKRLLEAEKDGELIELKRRRPAVGFTLGPAEQEGTVQVDRVQDGPAARAGIKKGDLILEADGRRIRSAYQAVNRIMTKQPGDKMTLLIDRGGKQRQVELTLDVAGGPPVGALEADRRQIQVGPQLRVSNQGPNQITVRNSQGVEEVGIDAPIRSRRPPTDEVEMLRIQINGFEKVIQKLQTELSIRDQSQSATDKLVQSLREEIAALKKPEVGGRKSEVGGLKSEVGDRKPVDGR